MKAIFRFSAMAFVIALLVQPLAAQNLRDLVRAINERDLPRVQELLREGVDPDVSTDLDGDTALHAAAYAGVGPAIIEALLNAGADPTALNRRGRTPAQLALTVGEPGAARTIQQWVARQTQLEASRQQRAEQAVEERAAAAARADRELAIREMEARAAIENQQLLEELQELRAMVEQLVSAMAGQRSSTSLEPVPQERLTLQACTPGEQWRAPNPELDGQVVSFCLAACAYIADGAPGTREAARQSCATLNILVAQSADPRYNTAGKICGVCSSLGF